MSPAVVVLIIVILLALVVGGVVLSRRRRSTQLQQHFGPEYERSVTAASGDRRAAETALSERQQRRQEFDVRDLRPEERTRFRDSWAEIQRGFVDDPRQSLHSADLLVAEVMRTRGYPVDDDFDRRADDLSVDHPRVVQHYREARRVRDAEGEVDTENQRTAITSYRSLVNALLGDDDDRRDGRVGDQAERVPADRAEADRAGRDVVDRADAERPYDRDVAGRDLTDRDTTDRRDLTDRDLPDRDLPDRDLTDQTRADTDAGGRHALRENEPRRDVTGPADPNGPQSPRTEEHTR